MPDLVDEVMTRERPRLWRDLPEPAKQAVYARVQAQLPGIIREVTDQIGIHIDQLLDPKIMVIDHFEREPAPGRVDLPRLRPGAWQPCDRK